MLGILPVLFLISVTRLANCCTQINIVNDTIYYIESPNYPDEYPPYTDECWEVFASHPDDSSCTLLLNEIFFLTEGCCDILHLYDNDEFVGSYSGSDAFGTYLSTSDRMRLEFESDYSAQFPGFQISVQLSGSDVCNGTAAPPPESPLLYEISQRGTFYSSTGADFSSDCTNTYAYTMRERALSMVPVVNDGIGTTDICPGLTTDDVEVIGVSTIFVADGITGSTSMYWTLDVGGSQTIGSVEQCATQIGSHLSDHDNWVSPIIPDEPDCPGVRFDNDYFDTSEQEWICSVSREGQKSDGQVRNKTLNTSTLSFGINLVGSLLTGGGEDITEACLTQQIDYFRQSTYEQVGRTNELMGTELCDGQTVQLRMVSATLAGQGSQATSFQDIVMESLDAMTFDAVYACADEVSAYLQSHDNWQQPIIGTPPGCPALNFSPAEFNEETRRWVC